MHFIYQQIFILRDFLWGSFLLFLFVGVGLYLTVLLRGLQLRYLLYAFRFAFFEKSKGKRGDISHFQALMTSLAGAIGTGNIAGIAAGITLGGMGAVFWMWIAALLGMATKYSEAVLSVKYRQVDSLGNMAGGPMYYLEKGVGKKWAAQLFAGIGILASTGTGNLVQSNSLADAFLSVFHVNPWVVGIVIALLVASVLIGGIRNIGRIASIIVPFMAVLYLAAGCAVLLYHFDRIPAVLSLIGESAFTGQAAFGGFVGSSMFLALRTGVSRAVLSSEAGVGTIAIADAAAVTDYPARQGMVSMTGTFLSAFLICTITGLVLGVTGVMGTLGDSGQPITGASLAILAFDSVIPFGKYCIVVSLMFFAYSTILAWAYAGEKCWGYLFGHRNAWIYRIGFVLLLIPGAVLDLEFVWAFADVMNGLMAVPNLIALVLLSTVITNETKVFIHQLKREG